MHGTKDVALYVRLILELSEVHLSLLTHLIGHALTQQFRIQGVLLYVVSFALKRKEEYHGHPDEHSETTNICGLMHTPPKSEACTASYRITSTIPRL